MSSKRCPCGSKLDFFACCGPYLGGAAKPPTAVALMRSRYTAYVEGAVDYIIETTAPERRATLDRADLLTYCESLRGVSLVITETTQGGPLDDTGFVTFEATLKSHNKEFTQRERSRFIRTDGRWYYVAGDLA